MDHASVMMEKSRVVGADSGTPGAASNHLPGSRAESAAGLPQTPTGTGTTRSCEVTASASTIAPPPTSAKRHW